MSLGGGQNTEGPNAGGIFVQFNQDCTSLVAGSSSGYHLFSLTPDDGVEEIYSSRSGQEVCIVDRLFSSSLVAIVTVAAPRKLIVCHYKKGTEICNYSYSNTILAVKLNRSRLVVCLEESLHIHNIRDMKILHTIRDTPGNSRGLCALSACAEPCLVAYPGSAAAGEVQIFDAAHLAARCVLPAHRSPLAALAFSPAADLLATASERGTVIRLFSTKDRTRLMEFRRGVKRCVTISSLAFSSCGTFLAVSSNTETVHVFRTAGEVAAGTGTGSGAAAGGAGAGAGEAEAGWVEWLARGLAAGAGLLPQQVSDVLQQGRAFAAARLPHTGYLARASVTTVSKSPRLLVATSQGVLYVYALDAAEGGECSLLRTHRLLQHDHRDQAPGGGERYASAVRGPPADTEAGRAEQLSGALEGSPPRAEYDLSDRGQFPDIPHH